MSHGIACSIPDPPAKPRVRRTLDAILTDLGVTSHSPNGLYIWLTRGKYYCELPDTRIRVHQDEHGRLILVPYYRPICGETHHLPEGIQMVNPDDGRERFREAVERCNEAQRAAHVRDIRRTYSNSGENRSVGWNDP